MTIEELNDLRPGTLIYEPTDWEVEPWIMDRRVGVTNYYTLTHPPDAEGVVNDKRPVYKRGIDLMHATLNEQTAWEYVRQRLTERINWIKQTKLTNQQL